LAAPVRQEQRTSMRSIKPESLGDAAFRRDHALRYAYVAGAMYKGIASKELVIAMGRAGLMGYLGTGGLQLDEIEEAIRFIQRELGDRLSYGANLLCDLEHPDVEDRTVDLLLSLAVRRIEAAAFVRITPSLVRYRLRGLSRAPNGDVRISHQVLAKVSRPEVAAVFMQPAPEAIVRDLLAAGRITAEQAQFAAQVPMADDVCVEADSGGHTDRGVAYALMPAMFAVRETAMASHAFSRPIRIGAAGGIGTPHAAAAAFVMGADFVLTGSVNQCTIEAGTSEPVKDLLQELSVQDTAYAPAGDMFELGAKVQVVKRGLFFPARANKLYELYQRYGSLDEIDQKTRQQIQEKYFRRSFEEVWTETKGHYLRTDPARAAAIEANPRQKMAAIFKWYFVHSSRLAMRGEVSQKVDFQIHCGPALGAFNQWVKGTEVECWRNRRVADIAERIMVGAADVLNERYARLHSTADQVLAEEGLGEPRSLSALERS